MFQCLIHGQY